MINKQTLTCPNCSRDFEAELSNIDFKNSGGRLVAYINFLTQEDNINDTILCPQCALETKPVQPGKWDIC